MKNNDDQKFSVGDIVVFKDEKVTIELGPGLIIEGPIMIKKDSARIFMTFTVPAVKVRWASGENSWVGVKWLIRLN